jgi:hypothetical protein
MSKSMLCREIDGPPSFLAAQAANDLISQRALLVSFQCFLSPAILVSRS